MGNLDVALSEGDVICVCSQFGEISDVHLVREEGTGKSKGFAFVKYENAKSCILAVDNLCGSNVCGRSLRIDHVENYRLPKEVLEKQEQEEGGGQVDVTKAGQAYQGKELENDYSLEQGQDLFAPVASSSSSNTNANPPTTEDKDRSEEARRKRKEERRLLRLQKEQRRQERERKRTEREEKERKKRSKKVKRDDSIDNESDSRRETKQDRKKHSSRKRHSRDEEDSKERKSKKREKRSRSRSRSVS